MISLINRLCFATVLAVLLCACGSKESTVKAQIDPKAFDAAAPEAKQMWDQATAAAARNDFGSAIMGLRMLSRQPNGPERSQAVREAMGVYEAKLLEAAKKGDAAARKDAQTLGLSLTSE